MRRVKVDRGLCTVFIHHTSASLIVCENAAAEVRRVLSVLARLVPMAIPIRHTDEGPDDMPAHVRSILTQTSISLPVNAVDATWDWQGSISGNIARPRIIGE